jgi:hypothetical protein
MYSIGKVSIVTITTNSDNKYIQGDFESCADILTSGRTLHR